MATIKKASERDISLDKYSTSKCKTLIVGAEAAPYATVGGFSSVLAYLSKALKKRGHDVRIFMPKFGSIDESAFKIKTIYEGLKVPTDDEAIPYLQCNIKMTKLPNGITTYFLENHEYYEKRANVYGYSDDYTRWALLSRAALEFIKTKIFIPDIIHANDWHTGIIANYLKTTYAKDPILTNIATVFTIHNLRYQGLFDHTHVSELDYDDGKSPVASFFSETLSKQNFMRRGILFSDVINTVSKTYSREILTPEFGEGLGKLLLEVKSKLFGIVNGLDYQEYNPETDTLIEQNYDISTLSKRGANKRALQKEFNLPVKPTTLLLGFVGRLDWMKGVDLLVSTLHHLLKDYDVQFVQVGGGDGGLVDMLNNLKNAFPNQVGIHPYPNFTLPRLMFAGCDCIIYPSRFEPCGIVQIEAMRYGAIPIVRNVGGLADTVIGFDAKGNTGNGFLFNGFDEFSLFGQLVRAYEIYQNKPVWGKLQKNAMRSDFSWSYSAKEYERLYSTAKSFKGKTDVKAKSVPVDDL